MSEPLLVIGNGMAAAKLCEELTRRALGRHAVAVIGAEPHLAYNRVLLSEVLAGHMSAAEAEMKPASWWRARGVTLQYGTPAAAIDRAAREVVLTDGRRLPFGNHSPGLFARCAQRLTRGSVPEVRSQIIK